MGVLLGEGIKFILWEFDFILWFINIGIGDKSEVLCLDWSDL